MVPSLRGWKVGEPLTVDCRAAVQRFLKDGTWTERGNPKTARTLVRGHSQRYRTGPGKEKVVWVRKEPFFNPKHGPTLIRPVSLAPSPEEGP